MYKYFPETAKKNFSSKGKDIFEEIGEDILRGVILDVLTGKNLRDSTELLTRKRIININAATLAMFIKGASSERDFINNIPNNAHKTLNKARLKKDEKWLMEWSLGLTDKGFQNILRDETSGLEKYKEDYIRITQDAIEGFKADYGNLKGNIELNSKEKAILSWDFMTQLMTTIGAQTLAIRGSDKSKFGKLFEKLILGSLLTLLGFESISPFKITSTNKVFWLSDRINKRESDATLLYEKGKGVKFDIGFIGRGNPEISLDKVSRFERDIQLGRNKFNMSTIIIVDRIGANSNIEKLAKEINGYIVQMSGAYWPIKVAQILSALFGYKDQILKMNDKSLNSYFSSKITIKTIKELI